MNYYSLTWASMPSALKGAARTVDLFGKLDEYRTYPNADSEMIRNDWLAVGKDLRVSVDEYGREQEQSLLAESSYSTAE